MLKCFSPGLSWGQNLIISTSACYLVPSFTRMSGFDRFFPFAVWSVYFFSKQRKVTTNIYVYVSIRVLIYLLASFHVRVLIKCLDINDR